MVDTIHQMDEMVEVAEEQQIAVEVLVLDHRDTMEEPDRIHLAHTHLLVAVVVLEQLAQMLQVAFREMVVREPPTPYPDQASLMVEVEAGVA